MPTHAQWLLNGPNMNIHQVSFTYLTFNILVDTLPGCHEASLIYGNAGQIKGSIQLQYPRQLSFQEALHTAPDRPNASICFMFALFNLLKERLLLTHLFSEQEDEDEGAAVLGQCAARLATAAARSTKFPDDRWNSLEKAAQQTLEQARQDSSPRGVRNLHKRLNGQATPDDPTLDNISENALQARVEMAIYYATLMRDNVFETNIGSLRITGNPQGIEEMRWGMLTTQLLNQEQIDLLTCHEAFNPHQSISSKIGSQAIHIDARQVNSYIDETLEHYIEYILKQVPPGTQPPPYSGELILPDSPHFDDLRQIEAIRLVFIKDGIWCSLVRSLLKYDYHCFLWRASEALIEPLISPAFSIGLHILLAAVWRDACLTQPGTFKTDQQRLTRSYTRPIHYTRRRVHYLPRLTWASTAEQQRIQEHTSTLKRRHQVNGFVRTLHQQPDYVPPDSVIRQALDDYGAEARLPGVGQTYVRSHLRGIGELQLPDQPDAIVCKGLLQAMAILHRQADHWTDHAPIRPIDEA